ncbi:MAG TPA: VOC family protein [Ilumatobacteraceae bacterium]|nr:VOC family protein [Ilumatobacteraceae bacterium]
MIRRLNHAVLWVREARASAEFYQRVLGFEAVGSMGDQAVFLRADGSTNDHDLGLFSVGARPRPAPHSPGLYHLAWQVHTIEDLAALRARLLEAGALVGESDHGASKSLYAVDPDGIEFEVMWAVPRENWPREGPGTSRLDLDAELARWSAVDTADQ